MNVAAPKSMTVRYSQLEVGDQFQYRGVGDVMTVTHKIECDGTILVAARNERTKKLDGRAVNPGWRIDKIILTSKER